MSKIYVKFKKPDTIEEFIKELISFPHYGGTYLTGVETYHNPECTEVQCDSMRRRSFDDILDCVNTYFDNITPQELMERLTRIRIPQENGNQFKLYCAHCPTINRSVMIFYKSTSGEELTELKGDSQWSWKELFEMVGVTNNVELEEYYKKYDLVQTEEVSVTN